MTDFPGQECREGDTLPGGLVLALIGCAHMDGTD